MEPTGNNVPDKLNPGRELLRQYRICNPDLVILPFVPGTSRPYRHIPDPVRPQSARDWTEEIWPRHANVGIATGAPNRLVVLSMPIASRGAFIEDILDHDAEMSPYQVRRPGVAQFYFRSRYDCGPGPGKSALSDRPEIIAYSDERCVTGVGSVIRGAAVIAAWDQTLELRHLPELPRYLAEDFGFAKIDSPLGFSPRFKL